MTMRWRFHNCEEKALDKKCFRKYDELDCLSCVLISPSSGVLPMVNAANIFRQVFVPTSPPQVVALITEYWSENEEVDARFFFCHVSFSIAQTTTKAPNLCFALFVIKPGACFFAGDGPY